MPGAPLTLHLMTASLASGDAIGNYILTLRRLWQSWGVRVRLYADHIAPALRAVAGPSSSYRPDGAGLLWYHFSIDAANLDLARRSPDYKILDYHGIAPPHLFQGQNPTLEALCRRGRDHLPGLAGLFDRSVVHSAIMRQELLNHGFPEPRLHQLPLCIDLARYGAPDPGLSRWLSQLPYLLFVGRVVPQKDVLAILRLYAALRRHRPALHLILAGSRDQTPAYQRQLDALVRHEGLTQQVLFTGQIDNPAVLAALYAHARFLVVLSEWESFCVPLVEAAYFGTPAVIHDRPPLPEIAGPAALLIDRQRPDDAAAQVAACLADPAALATRRAVARRWSTRFTDAALARDLLAQLVHWFPPAAARRPLEARL